MTTVGGGGALYLSIQGFSSLPQSYFSSSSSFCSFQRPSNQNCVSQMLLYIGAFATSYTNTFIQESPFFFFPVQA